VVGPAPPEKEKLMFATLLAFAVTAAAPEPPRYAVVDSIAGPDGRYDYISVDPVMGRLFVGRGGGVMAIDLAGARLTPVLSPGEGVAAVMLLPGTPYLLATNGDANKATIVDRKSGRIAATIPTGRDPDGAAYDAKSGLAFVMNGESEDVTVIDPRRRRAVATIPVGGKPEAAVADGKGHLFVNIEDTAETARIDIATRKVSVRYKLAGCEEPTGIDYDPVTGLLIAACHNGIAKLVDAASGADRGKFEIGKMADGAIFDAARRLIYVPANDGTLAIAAIDQRGTVTALDMVKTQVGARTAALDPTNGRLYLPATDYAPNAAGEPQRVPGTFKVLVVAPVGQAR
jgi:YVTN family beta-propeller protein